MKNKNYPAAIEVAKSVNDFFNHINEVSKWWSKYFEGSSTMILTQRLHNYIKNVKF